MTCTATYGDANDFGAKFCRDFDWEDEAVINRNLELAAGSINAARGSQGACDCTLADWAVNYLIDLNCVIAAAFWDCKCVRIADDKRAAMADWAQAELEKIRVGQIELCDGHTGTDYIALGWAQYSFTERNAARIIVNTLMRESA